MSVCLSGGGVVAKLAVAAFTLAWTHTIEHTKWQEDWRVAGHELVITAARVQGSGAGMDPGPGAVLKDGFWEWHPQHIPPRHQILMRRAPQAGDWRLCIAGTCHAFAHWLPAAADPVTLTPCADPPTARADGR